MENNRVVIRVLDGRTVKGYLKEFSETSETVTMKEYESGKTVTIPVSSLKAIFFVKSFEGKPDYREKKRYSTKSRKGKRVYVKFKDSETLLGYLEGDIPWEKGFFISSRSDEKKGFFMIPADEESNNIKIFVIASSVSDVTLI